MPNAGFPERLRAARDLSGLSARGLAELAGLTDSHVGLLESGQRAPSALTASKLARVLGTSLDWLVVGIGVAPSVAEVRAAVESARASAPTEAA